jgi:ClpP class serine protease
MVGDSGVAMLRVSGTLVHRLGSLRPYSGMTGYNGLRQAYMTAISDDAVKAVMLDVDSGGGEVSGLFDLVDAMYDARGEKPVWAVLDDMAYSAAYAIASVADRIIVPRTGGTGSIGVIAMHVDLSKALGANGAKVTFITSEGADRKTDGHSEIPLSEEAYKAFKTEVDEAGRLFDETVARNRGLTSKAVNDLKAATFMGASGVRAGLADAVMAPDAAFRALLAELA